MHLSAKLFGETKRFNEVDDWTFLDLHEAIREAFNIQRDFDLFIGDNKLTKNSTAKISGSDIVSGDRIRIFIDSSESPTVIHERDASETTESCSRHSDLSGQASRDEVIEMENMSVRDVIIKAMENAGYEVLSEKGSLIQFKHASSSKLAEIGLLEYDDGNFSTQSNFVEAGRRIPIASTFFSISSRTLMADVKRRLIEPLNYTIFGPSNSLLRLLCFEELAERLFLLLPAVCVLRLEFISKEAMSICHERRMERIWKLLLKRDFKDLNPDSMESYRECYKRAHMKRRNSRAVLEDIPHSSSLFPPVYPYPDFPEFGPPDFPERFPRGRPPYRPIAPDPDMPQGPFGGDPDYPFGRFGPRHPLLNPRSDPFGNSEIMPSRPMRPQGQPREFPRGGGGSSHWFG